MQFVSGLMNNLFSVLGFISIPGGWCSLKKTDYLSYLEAIKIDKIVGKNKHLIRSRTNLELFELLS